MSIASLDKAIEVCIEIQQRITCEICMGQTVSPCKFSCEHLICHACAVRHCEDEMPPVRAGSSGGRRKSGARVLTSCVLCAPIIPLGAVRTELKVSYPLRDIVEAYVQFKAAVLAYDERTNVGTIQKEFAAVPAKNHDAVVGESSSRPEKRKKRKGKAPVKVTEGGTTSVLAFRGQELGDLPGDSVGSSPDKGTGAVQTIDGAAPGSVEQQPDATAEPVGASVSKSPQSTTGVEGKVASQSSASGSVVSGSALHRGPGNSPPNSLPSQADRTEIYQCPSPPNEASPNASVRSKTSQFSVNLSSGEEEEEEDEQEEEQEEKQEQEQEQEQGVAPRTMDVSDVDGELVINIATQHCLPSPMAVHWAPTATGGAGHEAGSGTVHRGARTPEERKKQYSRELGIDSQLTVLTPPLDLGTLDVDSSEDSPEATMLPELARGMEPAVAESAGTMPGVAAPAIDEEDTHLSQPCASVLASPVATRPATAAAGAGAAASQDLAHVSSIHGTPSGSLPTSSVSSPTAATIQPFSSLKKAPRTTTGGSAAAGGVTFQTQSPVCSASADSASVSSREITSGWGLGLKQELDVLRRMAMDAETQVATEMAPGPRGSVAGTGDEDEDEVNVSNLSTQLSAHAEMAPSEPGLSSSMFAVSFTGLSIDNRLHLQHCAKNGWFSVVDLGSRVPFWRAIVEDNLVHGVAAMFASGSQSLVRGMSRVCHLRGQSIQFVVTDACKETQADDVREGGVLCEGRSLTYLFALSMGLPVVDSRFIVDSLLDDHLLAPLECGGGATYAVSGSVHDAVPGAVNRSLCRGGHTASWTFVVSRNNRGCSNLLSCYEFDLTELFPLPTGNSASSSSTTSHTEHQILSIEYLLLVVYYNGGYVSRPSYESLVLPVLQDAVEGYIASSGSDASVTDTLFDAFQCFLLVPEELRKCRSVQCITLTNRMDEEDVVVVVGQKRKLVGAASPPLDLYGGLDMEASQMSQDTLTGNIVKTTRPLKWFYDLIFNYSRPGQAGYR